MGCDTVASWRASSIAWPPTLSATWRPEPSSTPNHTEPWPPEPRFAVTRHRSATVTPTAGSATRAGPPPASEAPTASPASSSANRSAAPNGRASGQNTDNVPTTPSSGTRTGTPA